MKDKLTKALLALPEQLKVAGIKPLTDSESEFYAGSSQWRPRRVIETINLEGLPKNALQREIIRRVVDSSKCANFRKALQMYTSSGIELTRDNRSLIIRLRQDSKMLDRLWLTDYWMRPPTMAEFLNDNLYLGGILRTTATNRGLWPGWRQELTAHLGRHSFLNNVLIGGAIGIGKSLVMTITLLYRILQTCCLRDPCAFYGVGTATELHFVLLSITEGTVRNTLWTNLLTLMRSCPFFSAHCGFDPQAEYANLKLKLTPRHEERNDPAIIISGGSQPQHFIGLAVLGAGLDEMNFRLNHDANVRAMELYHRVLNRITSRFPRYNGFQPGLCVTASSAADQNSFTSQVEQEIRAHHDLLREHIFKKAVFEIKPPAEPPRWFFKVALGSRTGDPRMLSGFFDSQGNLIPRPPGSPAHHSDLPEGSVERLDSRLIPGLYHRDFDRNLRQALNDILGETNTASHCFLRSLADVEACLALSQEILNPEKQSPINLSAADQGYLSDFLIHPHFVARRPDGGFQPKRHPQALRYVHLDLALTGQAGLAICHLIPPEPDADTAIGWRNLVEYDLILAIVGGDGGHIPLAKIQDFLQWLKTNCGYRFGLVTADQFQSAQLRQTLTAAGFPTAELSVDRTKEAYVCWREACQARGLRLYPQPTLMRELRQLVENDRKIDHLDGGTKDVADAVVGAHLNAIRAITEQDRVAGAPPVIGGIQLTPVAPENDPFQLQPRLTSRPSPDIFV